MLTTKDFHPSGKLGSRPEHECNYEELSWATNLGAKMTHWGVEEDSSLCLSESQIPRNCPLVSPTNKAMRKPADTGTHETGP